MVLMTTLVCISGPPKFMLFMSSQLDAMIVEMSFSAEVAGFFPDRSISGVKWWSLWRRWLVAVN